ncbi:transferase [Ascochyta rabiei]|uniref:Transferase n=1 Tax=Didymella rabiei TaxID=5454 RepID=A0A163BN90_DIDRA|nr:transferase [Ascochyta rabiei]
MAQPLQQADIIFPHLSNTPNFSTTLSSLKRSALSITNRLNSITNDSKFVTRVAASYDLPLVANERCGSWYIPLDLKTASVYFKSTDGHMGEWAFSLRRLNLQLLDVVSQHGGCVIVDSTRRGKSMPDALSKTVPLWCCVINRAVFRNSEYELDLFTPPTAVSESEHTQMERRVNGFVQQFLDICKPDVQALQSKLRKPLRPMWVTQASTLPHTAPDFPDFHPVILCTASRRVQGAEASEGGYIQGAADDHEAWSHGLTPPLFWTNKNELVQTNEEDLPAKIAELVGQDRGTDAVSTLIKPTHGFYVSSSQNVDLTSFDMVVSCTPEPLPHNLLNDAGVGAYLHLACQNGKLGSRDLRTQLPALRSLALMSNLASKRILVCCPTGKDLSVGTALAYLCLYVNEDGTIDSRQVRNIDKTLIKQRLSWITTSNPALNPSRATLQSVNSVLMSSETSKSPLPTLKDPSRYDSNWNLLPPTPSSRPSIPSTATTHPIPSLFITLAAHTWSFTRTLTSARPTHPSGTVTGHASFTATPQPTTLLYAESGTFTTTTGLQLSARRKYVYELLTPDEGGAPRIVVRFFDDAAGRQDVGPSGEGVGGLFVEMGDLNAEGESEDVLVAKNRDQHLCGADLYAASWRFSDGMAGREGEPWWEARYDVKGPGKDYVSTTRYVRGVPGVDHE